MTTRALIGLAVGSGLEAVEAAVVRADGIGLGMAPAVVGAARRPLPVEVREAGRRAARDGAVAPPEFARDLAEVLTMAARQAAAAADLDLRRATAVGLLLGGPAAAHGPAEWVAERTGLTVVAGFAGRDAAAGGAGRPLTPAADYLLFRHPYEDRLLVHLGTATSVVYLPAGGKASDVAGFEAGPGNRLLDDLTALGTRGREATDRGGAKAVQGRCLDELLDRWLGHPYFVRKPPKVVPASTFGTTFQKDAFESARGLDGTLHDLLCTATHLAARGVGLGCRRWLPDDRPGVPQRVLVSGGGTRNGFLWKLLAAEFPKAPVGRLDEAGVGALGRGAAGAAVLAGLTLDGVAANLPLLTGAAGGRLLGRLVPGDQRNWAACSAWMARQLGDYPGYGRAA